MEISADAILAGFGGLTTALVVLYRNQLKSQARCEANEVRMSLKVEELATYQRDNMARMNDRAVELAAVSLPLLDRAVRILRRHESEHTPTDDVLRIKHPSGETTSFIKAKK